MKKTVFLLMILYPIFLCAQTFNYNAQAAVEYADYWWDGRNTRDWVKDSINYNPEYDWGFPYYNYDRHGGDCANFVSQCLKEGGWDFSAGIDGKGTGVDNRGCISGVNNIRKHLHYKGTPYVDVYYSAADDNRLYHSLGDPLFISDAKGTVRHSLICTYINDKEALYNTHSKDYQYVRRKGFAKLMPCGTYFNLTYPAHCFNC